MNDLKRSICQIGDLLLKKKYFIIAICFCLVPVVFATLHLFVNGMSLQDFYLPAREGNDEVMYYKQVESIINYGIPQGYFGYNEGHAEIFSFSAWSPFLMIAWSLFTGLFGLSSTTVVLCNVFLMSLAMLVFALTARPNIKQALLITIFYGTFVVITRVCFSMLPETTCYSLTIMLIGLSYSAKRENKAHKIVLLYIISFLLTLMRPFYFPLLFIPSYFWYKKSEKKATFCGIVFISVTTWVSYLFVATKLCAPLFSFFDKMAEFSLISIMRDVCCGMKMFAKLLRDCFITGGSGKAIFLYMIMFALLVMFVYETYQRKKVVDLVMIFWIMYFVLMVIAAAYLFPGAVAEKHFCEFIVMGLFVCGMEFSLNRKYYLVLEISLLYICILLSDYTVVVPNQELRTLISENSDILESKMKLSMEKTPSYSNTVDWVLTDDGTFIPWQMLYAVPAGFGINLCYENWFLDENSIIKARYVATIPGGLTEGKCIAYGGEKIEEYGGLVIYEMY